MCDDSGVICAGGDEMITIDLGGMGVDDLDEQTKRELLVNGPFAKSPGPKCRWCKGTGKVMLLVSESDCDCVTKPVGGSRHRA